MDNTVRIVVCGKFSPLLAMLDHAVEERFLKPENRALVLASDLHRWTAALDFGPKRNPVAEITLPVALDGNFKLDLSSDLVSPSRERSMRAEIGIFAGSFYLDWGGGTHVPPVVIIGGCAKQRRCDQLGVLSLSARSDSSVMWSHYADSHRGFLIGFSTEHEFFPRDKRTVPVVETGVSDFPPGFP